jgi:predicted nucleic acid-binding Zn ribbon protein
MGDWLRESPTIARRIAEAKVADHWPRVVGVYAASFTTSVEVRAGTLHVKVTSSAVRSELFMRRSALRSALNAAVGMEVVSGIVIR